MGEYYEFIILNISASICKPSNSKLLGYPDSGILGFLKYPASGLSNLALLLLILRTPSPAIVDKLIFSFRVSELWQYLMLKLQADVANNLLKCA